MVGKLKITTTITVELEDGDTLEILEAVDNVTDLDSKIQRHHLELTVSAIDGADDMIKMAVSNLVKALAHHDQPKNRTLN